MYVYIYMFLIIYIYVYNYILCIALESKQLHWRTCIIEVFVTKKNGLQLIPHH